MAITGPADEIFTSPTRTLAPVEKVARAQSWGVFVWGLAGFSGVVAQNSPVAAASRRSSSDRIGARAAAGRRRHHCLHLTRTAQSALKRVPLPAEQDRFWGFSGIWWEIPEVSGMNARKSSNHAGFRVRQSLHCVLSAHAGTPQRVCPLGHPVSRTISPHDCATSATGAS